MTRSPKMTGTRSHGVRLCGGEPDIATASDTNETSNGQSRRLRRSFRGPRVCLPICLPVNTRCIQLIRDQRHERA